jgi:hypothetical protein
MASTSAVRAISGDPSLAFVPVYSFSEIQESSETVSLVEIPFEFMVGDVRFPAGRYGLDRCEVPGMLRLRRAGEHTSGVLVQAIPGQHSNSPRELIFYCHRGSYFLAHVYGGGY